AQHRRRGVAAMDRANPGGCQSAARDAAGMTDAAVAHVLTTLDMGSHPFTAFKNALNKVVRTGERRAPENRGRRRAGFSQNPQLCLTTSLGARGGMQGPWPRCPGFPDRAAR